MKWIEEAVEKKRKHRAKKTRIEHYVVPNYQKPVYEDIRAVRHAYQKQLAFEVPERATRKLYD